jgi:hypothetical protein
VRLFPLPIILRDYTKTLLDRPNLTLSELLHETVKGADLKPCPSAAWFDRQLRSSNCLILIDGLDEVSDAYRAQVVKWLERQIDAHGGNNRFIVTARPNAYAANPVGPVDQLKILPFNPTQIQRFVENWYGANLKKQYPKEMKRAQQATREFSQALLKKIRQKPEIALLAQNPLLLNMIAQLDYLRESEIPINRTDLYKKVCNMMLGERDRTRDIPAMILKVETQQSLLAQLAYEMHTRQNLDQPDQGVLQLPIEDLQEFFSGKVAAFTDASPLEVIKNIETRSELLIEREKDRYGFAHRSFQEFLAAQHIANEKLEAVLLAKLDNTWWRETILFYAGLREATPIVAACLSQPKISAKTLALAALAQAEGELRPDLKHRLQTRLSQGANSDDPEERRLITETLLELWLREFRYLNDRVEVLPEPIAYPEFQRFLEDRPEYTPSHWKQSRFAVQDARSAVIGVSPQAARAFCLWLDKMQEGEGWSYRLPTNAESQADWSAHWVMADFELILVNGQLPRKKLSEWAKGPLRKGNRDVTLSFNDYQSWAGWYQHLTYRGGDAKSAFQSVLEKNTQNFNHRVLALARAPALDIARAFALDRARALARALDHALDLDLARALDLDHGHGRDLEKVFNVSLPHALQKKASELPSEKVQELRASIALGVSATQLLSGKECLQDIEKTSDKKSLSEVLWQEIETRLATEDQANKAEKQALETLIDRYVYLRCMEMRRTGELAPIEHLYIVRERIE